MNYRSAVQLFLYLLLCYSAALWQVLQGITSWLSTTYSCYSCTREYIFESNPGYQSSRIIFPTLVLKPYQLSQIYSQLNSYRLGSWFLNKKGSLCHKYLPPIKILCPWLFEFKTLKSFKRVIQPIIFLSDKISFEDISNKSETVQETKRSV